MCVRISINLSELFITWVRSPQRWHVHVDRLSGSQYEAAAYSAIAMPSSAAYAGEHNGLQQQTKAIKTTRQGGAR